MRDPEEKKVNFTRLKPMVSEDVPTECKTLWQSRAYSHLHCVEFRNMDVQQPLALNYTIYLVGSDHFNTERLTPTPFSQPYGVPRKGEAYAFKLCSWAGWAI